jgi:hypothetical protein
MTRTLFILIMLAFAATAYAADDCCPVDTQSTAAQLVPVQQQMPEGHPPVQSQDLPQGHPPMQSQALPQGHPPLPGATSQPATSQPGSASLVIRAMQGTEGGPVVAGDPVTVVLYKRTGPFRTIETQLDDHGIVMIEDIELNETIQPQIYVEHQGVRYEVVGEFLTFQKPTQQVDVTVNETTREQPDWSIAMRHVIVSRDGQSYRVKDVFTLDNPSDRTYLGPEVAQGETPKPTVAVPIPAAARDVTWTRSFDDCCTALKNGVVVNHAPIRAGRTRYQIDYRVPIADGKTVLDFVSPRATAALMVFLPDDQAQVDTDDFESLGTFDMGSHQPMRTFKHADVTAGDKSVLTIHADVTQAATEPDAVDATDSTPKMLAGIGVLGAVITGLLMMFLKKPQPKKG